MSAAAYSEQFDMGRVFLRAYDIIKRHLPVLAALVLILYGLPKIGATLVHRITGDLPFFHYFSDATAFLYGLVAFLGYLAFQASAANVVVADLNDHPPSFGGAVRTGMRFLAPLIGLAIVSCIAVVVGFVCLIIPGFFLLTIWAVAAPAMVVERLDIGQSLSRSAQLTEGYRWYVFAVGAIFVIASGIGHSLVDHHKAFSDNYGLFATIGRTVSELLGDAMDTIFAAIGGVLAMSLYYELRVLKESAGPEDLAGVLE